MVVYQGAYMKLLNTAAIIALAGAGCVAQAQAQTYLQQFQAAKPELDRLITSMRYREAIEKILGIIPADIPVFQSDPTNPQVGLNNYYELATIQDFHDYLYRALFMSGDTEGAIAAIKKAEQIAIKNAAETEAALSPLIATWSNAIEESKKNLEDATPVKEQLEARKNELEAQKRRSRKENAELEQIKGDLSSLQANITIWETNLKNAPGVVSQLNRYINDAKRDTTKFTKDIKDMEADFASESAEIEKVGGEAKYVDAVLNNKNNFANKSKRDVVKLLNRLSFLDPSNSKVQQQLDIALKAE